MGGITVSWILAQPVRGYVAKSDGQPRTIIELRDPARLGNSITLVCDGEVGKLESVPAHKVITLQLDEVRGGRSRGELVGSASREAIEHALLGAD